MAIIQIKPIMTMEKRACILLLNLLLKSEYLYEEEITRVHEDLMALAEDKKYRDQCHFRKDTAIRFLEKKMHSLYDVINTLFTWNDTVNGDAFWREIAHRIEDKEHLPFAEIDSKLPY